VRTLHSQETVFGTEASARIAMKAGLDQDPHALPAADAGRLEASIGQQVRAFRKELGLTNMELARAAQLSPGMLSKIENGQISPSLASLRGLSHALDVSLTALFRGYERGGYAVHVRRGQGLNIERRGTRAGHHYQLLGHIPGGSITVEPYLVTLTEESDVFPLFQHDGLEFIYILSGRVGYRHGPSVYPLEPGDSLFFDASVAHGPEILTELPIRMISVISYTRA
jgi:transcriptional regulator with XRE-family HTH domain